MPESLQKPESVQKMVAISRPLHRVYQTNMWLFPTLPDNGGQGVGQASRVLNEQDSEAADDPRQQCIGTVDVVEMARRQMERETEALFDQSFDC